MLAMPAHIDQIIKKGGKRIARGSKKVSGWATLDVELYLECQARKVYDRQVGQKVLTQRPAMGITAGQAPTRKPYISVQPDEKVPPSINVIPLHLNMCWRFQWKVCDDSYVWPQKHFCYSCRAGHPTKDCPLMAGSTNTQHQQAPSTF